MHFVTSGSFIQEVKMGLKDELVVANDPNDETQEKESSEAEPIEESEPVQSDPVQSDNEQSETVEETQSESVEEETVSEDPEEEEEEEDLVDPQDELKEQCAEKAECQKYKDELDVCTERVSSKENTTETCAQELFDFIHCVDHCVSKSLFSKLK